MSELRRVPVGPGLLTGPLDKLEQLRLVGTRCHDCGEVMFGTYHSCANCASEDVEQIALGTKGKLWSYTVINHCPPEPYKGPSDPFIPFGEGLVEVPEGVRIVSVLDCDPADIQIGMELELYAYPLFVNECGEEVIAWKFRGIK